MKLAVRGFSVLLALSGIIWALQGFNILPGTFMRGNPVWILIGIITALAGGGLWVLSNRIQDD